MPSGIATDLRRDVKVSLAQPLFGVTCQCLPVHLADAAQRQRIDNMQFPRRGSAVQGFASAAVHLDGRPVSSEVPLKFGPRHCAQFSPKAVLA